MNRNTLILTVAGGLVVVLSLILISRHPDTPPDSGAEPAGGAAPASSGTVRQAPPPVTRDELLANFGDAQVARVERIVAQLRDFLRVAISVEESNLNGSTAGQRLGRELAHPVLASLDFSDEQRTRLVALLDDNQRRRVAAMRDAAERLRTAPEPMMAFILAGDALHQGLIPEEEFIRVREASAFRFESLIAPNASQPLANPRFLAAVEAILTPQQRERFREQLLNARDPALAPPPIEDQAMPLDDYAENIELVRRIYESSGLAPDSASDAELPDVPGQVPGALMPPEQ